MLFQYIFLAHFISAFTLNDFLKLAVSVIQKIL